LLNLDLNDEMQLLTRHNAHNFINSYHWMASSSIARRQPYLDFYRKTKCDDWKIKREVLLWN